jgi:hypothetical protein
MRILQDTSHYRVFLSWRFQAQGLYFHKSMVVIMLQNEKCNSYLIIRLQEQYRILNMLNVNYIIQKIKEGKDFPVVNPDANGNAWFVNDVKLVNKANDEMKLLDKIDTKRAAILMFTCMATSSKMHVPKFVFTGSIYCNRGIQNRTIKYINQLIRRRISGVF